MFHSPNELLNNDHLFRNQSMMQLMKFREKDIEKTSYVGAFMIQPSIIY